MQLTFSLQMFLDEWLSFHHHKSLFFYLAEFCKIRVMTLSFFLIAINDNEIYE